jgi:hypothetical protein
MEANQSLNRKENKIPGLGFQTLAGRVPAYVIILYQ